MRVGIKEHISQHSFIVNLSKNKSSKVHNYKVESTRCRILIPLCVKYNDKVQLSGGVLKISTVGTPLAGEVAK